MSFTDVFVLSLNLLRQWAWLIFPLAAFHVGWYIWVMYRELLVAKEEYERFVFLRIHLPREIESTPRSMEQVFHSIHGILGFVRAYDKVIWRERQPWFSFEMVGMNGNFYFIVAVERKRRSDIETAFYSEYPDIEIEEVSDYTLSVPLDIPNKDWNLHGYEFIEGGEDIWQFKTFADWELEKEIEAGRKIDPVAQWAEACSDLKPGENLWLQFIISPVASNEKEWFNRARALRMRIDSREVPPKPVIEQVFSGIGDFFRILGGEELEEEKEQAERPRMPTTLEKKAVDALGMKLERPVFDMNIRGLYIAQREIYLRARHAMLRGYFRPFSDYTNNWLRAHDKTETRITQFFNFFPETRRDIKRRRMLWYYRMRFLRQEEPNVGVEGFSMENLLYRLNTLELATIFHFPGREVSAPGLYRLPFKKAKAPVELPTV
ncbi:MAG: hypothetical protein HYZ69_02065 [Candidatus Colwellbacteria bacterium]|nr:hypothetical protein [Candidatus Colwellbacteria bacterium]